MTTIRQPGVVACTALGYIRHNFAQCLFLLRCHVSAMQLVERANKWSAELDMQDSVHFLFTNVSVSLAGEQNMLAVQAAGPAAHGVAGLGPTRCCCSVRTASAFWVEYQTATPSTVCPSTCQHGKVSKSSMHGTTSHKCWLSVSTSALFSSCGSC
jgi:hypothetical protein